MATHVAEAPPSLEGQFPDSRAECQDAYQTRQNVFLPATDLLRVSPSGAAHVTGPRRHRSLGGGDAVLETAVFMQETF